MLLVLALLASVLIGMIGLIVDVGFLITQRRAMQNASDAAAVAAAHALYTGATHGSAVNTATAYARENGFEAGGDSSIEVNIPPTSGPRSGNSDYVEVILRRDGASSFIHVLVPGDVPLVSRSVAGLSPFPEEYALIALNESACNAFEQTGSATLAITGGGVMVNSDCDTAMSKSGSGSLLVDGSIDVHGGYAVGGSSGTVDPTPRDHVPWTVEDPLADVPRPVPGEPAAGSPGTAASPQTWSISGGGEYTLQPGTYYGGLEITCSNCTVTLQPGLYIMAGGGFTKGGNPTIHGNGVTIYVTDCNGSADTDPCSGDGAAAPITLQGGGVLDLSPPTSGPYEGITFWQDVLITDDFRIAGNNSLVQGIFYAPGGRLELTGGADLGVVQLIADRIVVSGSAPLDLEYGAFRTFEAPDVVLVE